MNALRKYDKYTFFWNGIYSQWHIVDLTIDGITYNCAEQYMMAKKARMFGDFLTAAQIMETPLPREQKALGRQVKNFNPDVWNAIARDVVYRVNAVKFSDAHMDLQDELYATKGTLLVEASPYDNVWGIGLSEDEAVRVGVAHWRGTNWLGQVITEVREAIFGE
jgi:ribA/ribD-fused uncharacterized protein